MKKYVISEIKGKLQGETIIIEAENEKEACEKAGMTEIIPYFQRFDKSINKIYEVYELGHPSDVKYICHK